MQPLFPPAHTHTCATALDSRARSAASSPDRTPPPLAPLAPPSAASSSRRRRLGRPEMRPLRSRLAAAARGPPSAAPPEEGPATPARGCSWSRCAADSAEYTW